MGAHVKYKFKKGFLLDEEKLRKIHDIISKRLVGEIKYNIYREDSFSFETTKIEDVISQENLIGSRINELRIKTSMKSNLELLLYFDDSGVSLIIDGNDRDNVFLLNSELKEYISNEVSNQKIIGSNFESYIFGLGFLIFFVIFFSALFYGIVPSSSNIENDVIKNVLESNNTNEKLNLLIQTMYKENRKIDENKILHFIPFFLIPFMMLFYPGKVRNSISYFFPANLFLFGKESERYKQRLENKKNFFWVIIGGLIISVLGSLIVWIITLKS